MTQEAALDLIKNDMLLLEQSLEKSIDTKIPLINEVLMYLLSSGGKRLRPAFLILASKMCGYSGDKAASLSCVIEYIHTATLLHDDIIDGALYRRNKTSANKIYGSDICVLCGDFLYSRGYLLLTRDGDKDIQNILANAALMMSEGEVFQLIKTADIKITMDDYLKIIYSKTAVLFSASCETGAKLAKASEEECDALSNFGRNIGLAFQMSDDILDYFGDPEKTGKKNGTDLNESKLTLPVILVLKHCNADERKNIADILLKDIKSDEDLHYFVSLFEKYDIRRASWDIVDEYIENSITSLSLFEENEYKQALTALAYALIRREK